MSVAAVKAYDPMAWFPGVGKWMELSSVSNCGDWQARRANVRFRREQGGKPEFVHTLNGPASPSAAPSPASSRTTRTRRVGGLPEAMRGYMGGLERIEKE